MSGTVRAYKNQSMEDVIIQGCGSLEAGWQFCVDNNVAISDTPVPGTVYAVSDAALALGDAGTLTYLNSRGRLLGTLGPIPVVRGNTLLNEDTTPLLNEDGTPLLRE